MFLKKKHQKNLPISQYCGWRRRKKEQLQTDRANKQPQRIRSKSSTTIRQRIQQNSPTREGDFLENISWFCVGTWEDWRLEEEEVCQEIYYDLKDVSNIMWFFKGEKEKKKGKKM